MFNCSGGREAREYIRQKLFADKQQSFPTIPFSLLPSLSSLFLHPSFPQHISFPLFSPTFLFSLYLFLSLFLSVFSLFLSIPGSVFPLCLGFFFSALLSVFFILPRAPSICFPLSQPPVMGQPPGLAQRWDKREGQDSFCAFLRLKVSWQGQIEKQPTC